MPWKIRPDKYLDDREVHEIITATRERAQREQSRFSTADWMLVHLLLGSGLRVKEVSELTCGDLYIDGDRSSLYVRIGKRHSTRAGRDDFAHRHPKATNPRSVWFDEDLKAHLSDFLVSKQAAGESVAAEAPLFLSPVSGQAMSVSGLQKAFKRCTRLARLSPRYSIHCTRHTYARLLYAASDFDLLHVQAQLGHTQITTTEVYARAFNPRKREIAKKLSIAIGAVANTRRRRPEALCREDQREMKT